MKENNTENQVYPICPWCGEELDPAELELDVEEATLDDCHLSVDVICPACSKPIEVTANFVYSTYKNEEELDGLEMSEELYSGEEDEKDEGEDFDY